MIFEAIAGKFHFRFKDRVTAAGILAESLKDKITTEELRSALRVLGIPRGGVVTADVIARKLSCRLDIILPRKLTDPGACNRCYNGGRYYLPRRRAS